MNEEYDSDVSISRPLLAGEDQEIKHQPLQPAGYFRYLIAFLLSYGFLMDYLLRVNISFALDGGMVPKNCTHNDSRCWNQAEQGYVLSSFFWGYWVTQLPGAVVGGLVGASRVFGAGLFVGTLATFFCALSSGVSIWLLIVLRVLIGLGQGVTFPVALNIIAGWAPSHQFATFVAFSGGGQYLGAVLANSVSGLLVASNFLGGWPGVFYVFGGLGVLWSFLWFLFVTDDPRKSRWVSQEERDYLLCTAVPKKTITFDQIPWSGIFRSGRLWSTIFIHGCNGYGFFLLLSEIPKYMVEVLKYDIKASGFLASLPYVMIYLGYLTSGALSDSIITHNILSKTWTRKSCGLMALFLPACLLVGMAYLSNNVPILVLMNIAMFFQGFAHPCYYVNYVDLSPRYSAVLCGIGNGISAVAGILGPIFVGWLLNGVDRGNHDELCKRWRIAFISAAGVWGLGALQYCVFGSAEVQEWNYSGEVEEVVQPQNDDELFETSRALEGSRVFGI